MAEYVEHILKDRESDEAVTGQVGVVNRRKTAVFFDTVMIWGSLYISLLAVKRAQLELSKFRVQPSPYCQYISWVVDINNPQNLSMCYH